MAGSTSSLTFKIFGEDKTASKALSGVGKAASNMGKVLETTGKGGILLLVAAAAAAVKFGVDSVSAYGDLASEVTRLQRVVGGSAEDVSRLASAFKMTGLDADGTTKSLGIFEKHIVANDKAAKGLGIALHDAHGNLKPMADILPEVADKFAKMANGPQKSALALQLFGRAGLQMLPFLNKGAAGVKDLEAESDKLGTTLSGSDLAAVKANTIAKRKWGEAMLGVQVVIGRYLYPILTNLATWFTSTFIPVLGQVARWFTTYIGPALVAVAGWVTKTLLPAISALVTAFMQNVWPILKKVGDIIWTNLQPAFAAIADTVKTSIIPAIQRAWPFFQKLAIVIGVVVAAVLIAVSWLLGHLVPAVSKVIGYVATFVSSLAAAAVWVGRHVSSIVGFFTKMPGRISSAVSGLWDGIKSSFKAAINWIIGRWNNLSFTVGGGTVFGKDLPSFTLSTPDIPYLAKGGIVTSPTLAMIGEKGPEAVVPLNRLQGGGGPPIKVQLVLPNGRVIAETLVDYRRRSGKGLGLG